MFNLTGLQMQENQARRILNDLDTYRSRAVMPETDVDETCQDPVCGRNGTVARTEELLGLGGRHREHLADVVAGELVVEHRARAQASCPPPPSQLL